jgi:hypothetical protein
MIADPDTMDLLAWRAPHSGSVTSRLAAAEIVPHAENLRARVLECLQQHPAGLTDEEIQQLTGIEGSTERPRRGELARAGKIVKTWQTRATKSGRLAAVWQAKS